MSVSRPPVMLETRSPEKRAGILTPFRYRDFRLLWMGFAVSNLGTWMQFTALGYLVVAMAGSATRAALYVGILGAASAVPVVLISPFAGVVADRFPRRLVLTLTNSAIVLIALALAVLEGAKMLTVWEIFLFSGLRSTTAAFDAPARQSWVPLLVPREYVGNAIGLNSIAFNGPQVIGPPIAGILISTVGAAAAFYVNAVSTVAVLIALFFMAPSPPSSTAREGIFASIAAGLRFLFTHPVLRSVLLLLLVTSLLVRPYGQLLPAYAAHVVFVDARGLGVLFAASGIGAILGSLVTAMVGSHRRGFVWFLSAVLMSVGAVVLGLVHSFAVSLVTLVVIGASILSFAGSSNVLLQTLSPDDMRGRAISVFSMIMLGIVPAGSLVLGALASAIGLDRAIVAGGVVSLATAIWIYWSDPALRRV
ncbi:MAG: MFS transporter [Candidatus Eremiobacteraeota bacterium]|nr:MFS transporter [Candidatus Eremiobacteraeota bacterium]